MVRRHLYIIIDSLFHVCVSPNMYRTVDYARINWVFQSGTFHSTVTFPSNTEMFKANHRWLDSGLQSSRFLALAVVDDLFSALYNMRTTTGSRGEQTTTGTKINHLTQVGSKHTWSAVQLVLCWDFAAIPALWLMYVLADEEKRFQLYHSMAIGH